MRKTAPNNAGFTLIELLVVIAIIGLLAGGVLLALNRARLNAKITKARADLHQLRIAIDLLAADTGKWPNGCPQETTANPEVMLDQPAAGLNTIPTAGIIELPCEWTVEEVAVWKGPYVQLNPILDPWGTSYWFDADYQAIADDAIVLVSYGPDQTNYTSDDIIERIR